MTRQFIGKLPPMDKVPRFERQSFLNFFAKGQLKVPAIMVSGAMLQLIVSAVLPMRWAVIPAAAIMLNSIVTTILQTRSQEANPYMEGVVPGRATAQIPTTKGTFDSAPSSGSVVVFQLGAQYNHPLGFMAPGAKEVSKHFLSMNKELRDNREEHGLLGMSSWRANDRDTNNTFLMTYFFKDAESINRFAHMESHTKAWKAYHELPDKEHIGIFHETYIVPANGYESLYANCRPTLFGQAFVRSDTENGPKWVNTLVSADTPNLKSHYARLGRDQNGKVKE